MKHSIEAGTQQPKEYEQKLAWFRQYFEYREKICASTGKKFGFLEEEQVKELILMAHGLNPGGFRDTHYPTGWTNEDFKRLLSDLGVEEDEMRMSDEEVEDYRRTHEPTEEEQFEGWAYINRSAIEKWFRKNASQIRAWLGQAADDGWKNKDFKRLLPYLGIGDDETRRSRQLARQEAEDFIRIYEPEITKLELQDWAYYNREEIERWFKQNESQVRAWLDQAVG